MDGRRLGIRHDHGCAGIELFGLGRHRWCGLGGVDQADFYGRRLRRAGRHGVMPEQSGEDGDMRADGGRTDQPAVTALDTRQPTGAETPRRARKPGPLAVFFGRRPACSAHRNSMGRKTSMASRQESGESARPNGFPRLQWPTLGNGAGVSRQFGRPAACSDGPRAFRREAITRAACAPGRRHRNCPVPSGRPNQAPLGRRTCLLRRWHCVRPKSHWPPCARCRVEPRRTRP